MERGVGSTDAPGPGFDSLKIEWPSQETVVFQCIVTKPQGENQSELVPGPATPSPPGERERLVEYFVAD